MTISLTPEQRAWVDAHIARGDFSSLEDAIHQLVNERIAERIVEEHDDMSWARPLVDEALADVARGKVLTREEHETRIDTLMAAIQMK